MYALCDQRHWVLQCLTAFEYRRSGESRTKQADAPCQIASLVCLLGAGLCCGSPIDFLLAFLPTASSADSSSI